MAVGRSSKMAGFFSACGWLSMTFPSQPPFLLGASECHDGLFDRVTFMKRRTESAWRKLKHPFNSGFYLANLKWPRTGVYLQNGNVSLQNDAKFGTNPYWNRIYLDPPCTQKHGVYLFLVVFGGSMFIWSHQYQGARCFQHVQCCDLAYRLTNYPGPDFHHLCRTWKMCSRTSRTHHPLVGGAYSTRQRWAGLILISLMSLKSLWGNSYPHDLLNHSKAPTQTTS